MDRSFATLTSAWVYTVQSLLASGKEVESRDGGSKEILNFSFTLDDIAQNFVLNKVRRADPAYAAGELLWYLGGKAKTAPLERYAPSYKRFAEANGEAWGAYGPRIILNLRNVIQVLKDHPTTRQAVLPIWGMVDPVVTHRVNDVPCTVALHFILRDNRLHLVTYMRSNDVWLGMPYDAFSFTMLQRLIADEVGCNYGDYHHHVGSMHLYSRNLGLAREAISHYDNSDYRAYPSHWDTIQPLSSVMNAVHVEEEMQKGKQVELTRNTSWANDMLICCKDKMFPEKYMPTTSDLLYRAWELKRA